MHYQLELVGQLVGLSVCFGSSPGEVMQLDDKRPFMVRLRQSEEEMKSKRIVANPLFILSRFVTNTVNVADYNKFSYLRNNWVRLLFAYATTSIIGPVVFHLYL